MAHPIAWGAALAAALGLACGGPTPVEPRAVVLVVLDTLRPDHLSFHGYPHETAPWLAARAARGSVLRDARSTSSWTAPATASIFTGLYPHRHGVLAGLVARGGPVVGERVSVRAIPESIPTLPERFRAAGWRTFGIGANPNIGAGFGFRRGFERFEGLPFGSDDARLVGERVEAWRDEILASDRYFLYLHFNDPHDPYHEHPGWTRPAGDTPREQRRLRYDGEIRHADAELARIAALLGWSDETLLVAVSDHGEAFGEHGHFAHQPQSLYREVNDVLFLVSGPALGVRAGALAGPASLVDVVPTLAELAGWPVPEDVDGRSLAARVRGAPGAPPEPRSLLAHRLPYRRPSPQLWALFQGRWKLLALEGAGGGSRELYDLEADPDELHDLASRKPRRTRQLAAALASLRGGAEAGTRGDIDLDAGQVEALRGLGYTE